MVLCSAQGKPQVFLLFTYLSLWCWATNISIYVKAEIIYSLKPGDTLNATSDLCSERRTYCMSFYISYLSIYSKWNSDWVVWNANRNQPVDINSAVLSLNNSGVLKIESKFGEPIILYDSRQHSNNSNIVATLLDTGNFVLLVFQKNIVWESFDHPTDSLLPGMKLGVNHKTGHKWSLVSSISDSIPASGPFSLEWEATRKELVIKRREKVYWTSGKLMKNNRFKYIPGENFKVEIVSNEEEEYFRYTAPNEELIIWTLFQTGQLINREGGESGDIARADVCNGYNTNGGCQRWGEVKIPACRNPGDKFDSKRVYSNDNILYNIENASYGISDCQEMCWSNCSCFGFNYLYVINETGCVFLVSSKGLNIASSGSDNFNILIQNPTDHKGMYNSNYYIAILIFPKIKMTDWKLA